MKLSIFDSDNWREIGATLARNKTRTFLTAFGIFWGTAMLAMLHGGAGGLEGMLTRNFRGFATNTGIFSSGETSMAYRGYNKGMRWQITTDDINLAKRLTDKIDMSTSMVMRYGTFASGTKSRTGQVTGVEPEYFDMMIPGLLAGRLLNASDQRSQSKNVVIGRTVAADLFGVDPSAAIGRYISVNSLYYKVVGVAAEKGEARINGSLDDMVVMPLSTMQTAYHTGKKVDIFMFSAKQGYKPSQLFPVLRRAARANHPIHPDDEKAFFEMDISEMFEMVSNVFAGVNILALFVGLGSLVAGIIGVGNIMWIIVRERTKEIGIRRAIGAKPRDIIMQILSESMVLTTIAGIAGICFAVLVLYFANELTFDPILGDAGFQLSFTAAVVILILFLTLGTAAGLIPALKAMRIKPIEAMRDR